MFAGILSPFRECPVFLDHWKWRGLFFLQESLRPMRRNSLETAETFPRLHKRNVEMRALLLLTLWIATKHAVSYRHSFSGGPRCSRTVEYSGGSDRGCSKSGHIRTDSGTQNSLLAQLQKAKKMQSSKT